MLLMVLQDKTMLLIIESNTLKKYILKANDCDKAMKDDITGEF